MHHFGRFEESALRTHPTFEGHSEGYRCASLVDHADGSVHTGLSMNELAPGGTIHPHVHSFEEGFYILSGEAVVTINGSSYLLRPGRLRRGQGGNAARVARGLVVARAVARMAAPQPKPHGALARHVLSRRIGPSRRSAVTSRPRSISTAICSATSTSARSRAPSERQSVGLQGLEGVFLKWMIDENFGAAPPPAAVHRVSAGRRASACTTTRSKRPTSSSAAKSKARWTARTYRATAGDVLWTGVGCVHAFVNVSTEPVRWLETFCAAAAEGKRVPVHGASGRRRPGSWRGAS